MASLVLNDGNAVPLLAFGSGTALLLRKTIGSDSLDRPTIELIKSAMLAGYRHLDNAEAYGTEAEVGVAIKECIDEGVVNHRQDLFITSKVAARTMARALEADKALDESLAKLQLSYVDLYLLHTPYFAKSNADLQEAWTAMERVKASGKARSIGVSNYEPEHLQATLATAVVPPAINEVEFNPYTTKRSGLDRLGELRKHGIAVSAYGLLAPVTTNLPGPLDGVLERLSKKYDVSPGMICLRWSVAQNVVAITTSRKVTRMKEFLQVFDSTLTADEVREISDAGQASLPGGQELEPLIVQHMQRKGEQRFV